VVQDDGAAVWIHNGATPVRPAPVKHIREIALVVEFEGVAVLIIAAAWRTAEQIAAAVQPHRRNWRISRTKLIEELLVLALVGDLEDRAAVLVAAGRRRAVDIVLAIDGQPALRGRAVEPALEGVDDT